MATIKNFTDFILDFKQRLSEDPMPELIAKGELPNDENEQGLIFDFPDYPAFELSYGVNEQGTLESLQLSAWISGDEPQSEVSLLNEMLEHHHLLIPIMKDFLFSAYIGTTSNDACSYSATFDTGHGTMPGIEEEGAWELTVKITDYLS